MTKLSLIGQSDTLGVKGNAVLGGTANLEIEVPTSITTVRIAPGNGNQRFQWKLHCGADYSG